VEEAAETVRGSAEEKGVRLEVESTGAPLVVRGASVRLQQIVWNLLANAVKFTPPAGLVSLRLVREGREARVVVEDTGSGIAPEFLPHVFDRFRQADGSTTRQHGGLGLGLAIVRALADLHGGWVSAESAGPGRGSRFTFTLPCAASTAVIDEAMERVEAPALARPVLVVDDSPETLELLEMFFSRKGYEVLSADSAERALELARFRPPGLVISDISMPDVDGYQFLARLRELPGLRDVPAIALSGYAMEEDRQRALEAGFAVHVAKPVDPDELLNTIQQLTSE
jgi:CheY-like chemotaxis protein